MIRSRVFWLLAYQYTAGLCDTATGLLLLLAPEWTLRLMRVTIIPKPVVFASYVGIFVLGVGLTYIQAAITRTPGGIRDTNWHGQWSITALFRSLVALFLICQIAAGRMERAWITVAVVDATFATVQWLGLGRGWLKLAD
jgi:hypothetical protein